MLEKRRQAAGIVFAFWDTVLTLASFLLAYRLRLFLLPDAPLYPLADYWTLMLAIAFIWPATGFVLGVYRDPESASRGEAARSVFSLVFVASGVLATGIFLLKATFISRLLILFFAATNLLVLTTARLAVFALRPLLRERFGRYHYFLLVGTDADAQEFARLIEEHERAGMRLLGFVHPAAEGTETRAPAIALARSYPVWPLERLAEIIRTHVVDEVVFVVTKQELERMEEVFLLCEEEGLKTRVRLKFFPHVISRVSLERLHDTPLLTFSTTPENEVHLLLKRAFDMAVALLLLALLSPLLLLLAVLVKLSSRGPILFRQTRCGLGGRRFTLYKFRSMISDAEQRRAELQSYNQADGPLFKIENDPRCTLVGRWIRRLSLDELPQFYNILRGDMSFVGPRPALPEEVERYERWQRRRLRMKPGLTCLWALEGRSRLSFERWMKLDLEYIDNWSLGLDLKIFLKTIPLVLSGRGAY